MDTYFSSNALTGQLPHLLIENTEHGKGVKARHDLPAGEVLCNISGPTVSFSETLAMGRKESYCLQVDLNKYIKPAFPFYLFNHSCEPNCGINNRLQLVTTRYIKCGEELCWDYSTSMLERGWKLSCTCGTPSCRGTISDFDTLPQNMQQYYLDLNAVLPYIISHLENSTVNR